MFYIRYVDKMRLLSERNMKLQKDQIMPGLYKERKKLNTVASSKAVLNLLSEEIDKHEKKERQRL